MHHLIFIGLPGAGKTTVGRVVAKQLERRFIDFDDEIEGMFGISVSNIFSQHGETAFRDAEIELSRSLAKEPSAILAPGGGWSANRDAVAHLRLVSRIIYLRVSPAVALTRLADGIASRPLFAAGNHAMTMQTLYDARRSYYEDDADLTVDTDLLGKGTLITKVAWNSFSSAWEHSRRMMNEGFEAYSTSRSMRVMGPYTSGRDLPPTRGGISCISTESGLLNTVELEHIIERALLQIDGRISLNDLRGVLSDSGLEGGDEPGTPLTIH